MKRLVKGFFRKLGFEISKVGNTQPKPVVEPVSHDTMHAGLKRARDSWKIIPGTVIDLGAAAGTWTIKTQKIWAESHYVLFEPLEERKEELLRLKLSSKKMDVVHAAAGSSVGKVRFIVSGDLDGSGVYDAEKNENSREVELTTLDAELKRLNCKGPIVIKFDTHGFEIPILDGAKETLQQTDLIIMECYGFRIASKSLLFYEMCSHMEKLGFRLGDVVDIMRRPGDRLFWQCDAFFIRDSFKGFEHTTYAQ